MTFSFLGKWRMSFFIFFPLHVDEDLACVHKMSRDSSTTCLWPQNQIVPWNILNSLVTRSKPICQILSRVGRENSWVFTEFGIFASFVFFCTLLDPKKECDDDDVNPLFHDFQITQTMTYLKTKSHVHALTYSHKRYFQISGFQNTLMNLITFTSALRKVTFQEYDWIKTSILIIYDN